MALASERVTNAQGFTGFAPVALSSSFAVAVCMARDGALLRVTGSVRCAGRAGAPWKTSLLLITASSEGSPALEL
jgi:hypothetical protein